MYCVNKTKYLVRSTHTNIYSKFSFSPSKYNLSSREHLTRTYVTYQTSALSKIPSTKILSHIHTSAAPFHHHHPTILLLLLLHTHTTHTDPTIDSRSPLTHPNANEFNELHDNATGNFCTIAPR